VSDGQGSSPVTSGWETECKPFSPLVGSGANRVSRVLGGPSSSDVYAVWPKDTYVRVLRADCACVTRQAAVSAAGRFIASKAMVS
jgi:hypothetical protein